MEEVKAVPEHIFAFSIIKDAKGNIGVKPMVEGEKINSDQVYEACHAIVRNMDADIVASAVAIQLATIAQGQQQSGLVVPGGANLKRVK